MWYSGQESPGKALLLANHLTPLFCEPREEERCEEPIHYPNQERQRTLKGSCARERRVFLG